MTPPGPPKSPRELAEDAKHSGELEAEITALTDGTRSLEQAPWYPPRPGDVITVHHEHTPQHGPYTESYRVTPPRGPFGIGLEHTGTSPDTEEFRSLSGFFAQDEDGQPVTEMWMEAGPARITVERHGLIIHNGPESWR